MDWIIRDSADYSRHHALSASLVFCLSTAPGAAVAADVGREEAAASGSGPAVEATVNAGRLTLQTEGAPLAKVLRAIGEAGSFRVILRGEFAEPINRSFTSEPLEDAIRRLVKGHTVVTLRNDPDAASGATDLAEIRVIESPAQRAPALGDTASKSADPKMSHSVPDFAVEEEATDPVAKEEEYRQAVFYYTPPTKDDLLFELDEPDPAARVAAIPNVGALRPEEAIDVISHVFSNDEDKTVRSRAVAALTRLEGPGARTLLRERALSDEDTSLRAQALNALATSTGERSVNILGRALRHDPEPEVRMTALRALGRVGGAWARRTLERAAMDLDPEVRLAAEEALATWPETRD